uniref:Uncharacterized protein n=1 Tax=Eptatretus burgeri TaxID=7764 RepID=A0A8C4QWH6_EPTBU
MGKRKQILQLYLRANQSTRGIVINFKNKKSTGHDGMNNGLVKHIFPEIIVPLTHIFHLPLTSGVVPDKKKKKIAKIVPLPKKGDSHEACNYQPISCLTIFSKLLEKNYVYSSD